MAGLAEHELTGAVLARLKGCGDARLKRVLTSLVTHLHDFARDVELTEAEWFAAICFLTETGQRCDDRRQEFVLLSDTLGVSMLVDAINHRRTSGATASTVLGPFYVGGAPQLASGANIAAGFAGEPTFVSGRVTTNDGVALAGAVLDVWQTNGEGLYDVQVPGDAMFLRGRFRTASDGRYAFWTIKPVSYPIPSDGPVGRMLAATGRHPYRPAHIHFIVSAAGCLPVTTHLFVAGDPYLESDAVFGVKDALIVPFEDRPPGVTPDGGRSERPYLVAAFDFCLDKLPESAAQAADVPQS